jgi:hypothetical protein
LAADLLEQRDGKEREMNLTLIDVAFAMPVIGSAYVLIMHPASAPALDERAASWIAMRRDVSRTKASWLNRWVLRPFFAGLTTICHATDRIEEPNTRAGIRLPLLAYGVMIAVLIAYYVILIAVGALVLAVMFALIWFGLSVAGSFMGDGEASRTASPMPSRTETASRGGMLRGAHLVREGSFFDEPTEIRVDDEGREFKRGIMFDTPTGRRITEDGRIVNEGAGPFGIGSVETGLSVGEDGRVMRESDGILPFKERTGSRIDDDGRVLDEGIIVDTPTGMRWKKDE